MGAPGKAPASAKSLALIGFMGSGKSVVGALVAYRAGVPFLDLDFMIETEAGMAISDIFSVRGEASFRALESHVRAARERAAPSLARPSLYRGKEGDQAASRMQHCPTTALSVPAVGLVATP